MIRVYCKSEICICFIPQVETAYLCDAWNVVLLIISLLKVDTTTVILNSYAGGYTISGGAIDGNWTKLRDD